MQNVMTQTAPDNRRVIYAARNGRVLAHRAERDGYDAYATSQAVRTELAMDDEMDAEVGG